jgi:hypothetical protein
MMLTTEQIEELERYVVEKERERYTDNELWARLLELDERENEILNALPIAYRRRSKWLPDSQWNKLIRELTANQPVITCIVWHLTKRGDEALAGWLSERAEMKRQIGAKAAGIVEMRQ